MIESDVQPPAPAQLTLELSADSDEMSGTIYQRGHPARPFSGWLELLSVLETWRIAALGSRPEAMACACSNSAPVPRRE